SLSILQGGHRGPGDEGGMLIETEPGQERSEEGGQTACFASADRMKAYIAGAGVPARLLRRTLRQVGCSVEVGRLSVPSEVGGSAYPDAFFITEALDADAAASVHAWS